MKPIFLRDSCCEILDRLENSIIQMRQRVTGEILSLLDDNIHISTQLLNLVLSQRVLIIAHEIQKCRSPFRGVFSQLLCGILVSFHFLSIMILIHLSFKRYRIARTHLRIFKDLLSHLEHNLNGPAESWNGVREGAQGLQSLDTCRKRHV
jgi:hypothetical protein